MKIYVSNELACAYRWSDYGELEFAPFFGVHNTFDFENDGGLVDELLVGNEVIFFHGQERTFSEVYRIVENILGVNNHD